MPPKAGVRVTWPPSRILELLEEISKDQSAIQTYFPQGFTQVLGKIKQSKKFCAVFMKDDNYMLDLERLGFAKKVKKEDGGWEWNIDKWLERDSRDPVYDKIIVLKKNLTEGKFKKDHGVRDHWRSFEDVKDRGKRAESQIKIPYYFLLKQLHNPDDYTQRQPLIIPEPESSSSARKTNKRKNRSPSIISISSSDLEESDRSPIFSKADSPSSPIVTPGSKRIRRAVPTSSPDMDGDVNEEIRRTTTPLRDSAMSGPVEGEVDEGALSIEPPIPTVVVEGSSSGSSDSSSDPNTDSDSGSDSDSISTSGSPASQCSDSSDIEFIPSPEYGSVPTPSQSRRSVINNTNPDPRLRLPDGPGRAQEDAIEVDEQDEEDQDTCDQEAQLDLDKNAEKQAEPITYDSSSDTASSNEEIDDSESVPTEEVNTPLTRSEAMLWYRKCTALDQAALRTASVRALAEASKNGSNALEFVNDSTRLLFENCEGQRKSRRILSRARVEMGLEAIERILQRIHPTPQLLDDYRFLVSSKNRDDFIVDRLVRVLQNAGGLCFEDRESFNANNRSHACHLQWSFPVRPDRQKFIGTKLQFYPIAAWVDRCFVICIQAVLSLQPISKRISLLIRRSNKEPKSIGNSIKVFFSEELREPLRGSLWKLITMNKLRAEKTEEAFFTELERKNNHRAKRYKLGIRLVLSISQPNYLHTNGIPIIFMTPEDVCDFVERLRREKA